MKRLIRCVMVFSIALTVTVHTVAYARTPIEYYNDLAEIFGELVDISDTVWHDKTKLAYLTYIKESAGKISRPADLYRAGLRLEELTGYNIVYATKDKYYIETSGYTDDAPGGGALYGVPIDWLNYTKAYAEMLKWLDLIVDHGPAWPYQGHTSGGDGSTVETYTSPITLYPRFGTGSNKVLSADESKISNINNTASNKYSVILTYVYVNRPQASNTSINGMLAASQSPISVTYTPNDTGGTYTNYSVRIESESEIKYRKITPLDFSNNTSIYILGSETTSSPLNSADSDRVRVLWSTGEGLYVPPPTDDTPPEKEPDTYINIDWPDISLPTINLTNTSGPTTAGDIDFSPVTSRLDTISQNFNLFANSFNSYRSDWLEMWEAFEDAVDETGERLFNLESYLRSCRDWLINIFNKPTGGGSVTMPDPTDFGTGSTGDEGGGFWDWLGRFLDKLIGDLPDDVSSFATALGALTGKFPFSVPWDVAFLLGLMSQDPVTPEFDIVQPSISIQAGRVIYGQANTIHVDLSDYDEDARLFRACVVMAFCLCLATHTYETLRGMDWAIFE